MRDLGPRKVWSSLAHETEDHVRKHMEGQSGPASGRKEEAVLLPTPLSPGGLRPPPLTA